MEGRRLERVSDAIRTEIIEIISNELEDPRLAGVEVTDVPGGHLTMCLEPNVPVLAAAISRKLAANDEATQPPFSEGGKDLATPTMLDRSLV